MYEQVLGREVQDKVCQVLTNLLLLHLHDNFGKLMTLITLVSPVLK